MVWCQLVPVPADEATNEMRPGIAHCHDLYILDVLTAPASIPVNFVQQILQAGCMLSDSHYPVLCKCRHFPFC